MIIVEKQNYDCHLIIYSYVSFWTNPWGLYPPGNCSSFDCTARICVTEPGPAGLSGDSGADSDDAAIGTEGEADAARVAAFA